MAGTAVSQGLSLQLVVRSHGCWVPAAGTVPAAGCVESVPFRPGARSCNAAPLPSWNAPPRPLVDPSSALRRPRDRARRRASAHRAGRLRPRRRRARHPRGGEALRLDAVRVLRPRQPLPPRGRSRARAPVARDAPAELHVRAALQPPSRPRRPSVPGALRRPADRGRAVPRYGLRLRPRQSRARRALRSAEALAVERRLGERRAPALSETRSRPSALRRRRACAPRASLRR
jgi:hypothetical protein